MSTPENVACGMVSSYMLETQTVLQGAKKETVFILHETAILGGAHLNLSVRLVLVVLV